MIAAAHAFEADVARRGTTGLDEAAELAVYDSARQAAARLLNAPAGRRPGEQHDPGTLPGRLVAAPRRAGQRGVGRRRAPEQHLPLVPIAQETGVDVRLVPVLDDPAGFGLERVADQSPRVGSTRFSAHFCNTEEDVGLALGAVREILG